MDTLTHALSGALIARATAGKVPTEVADAAPARPSLRVRTRVALGFLAAAFPDTDVVLTWISPVAYMTQHRGVTHSWLMLPLWALLLAWIFARIARDPRGVRPYFGVCVLAIGIHIVGDWITSFGTMMLAPFSDYRFALGTTFIIDLIFSGIIIAGLIASLAWHRSRVPALLGLAVLAGYVVFQWTQQQKALEFGERYAQSQQLLDYRVAALPRPASPYNWTVVVSTPERHHMAHVNVARAQTPPAPTESDNFIWRLSAHYRTLSDARWQALEQFGADASERALAREAWQQPAFAFYRWFAAFGVLDHIERNGGETCVWFRDARFDFPGRDTRLFHYGLCRASAWRVYKLNADGSRTAV